nr:ATP-dependent helicase [Candidatus Eremiobacteraeota bacterium]
MSFDFDAQQQLAIQTPLDRGLLYIVGPVGSGKSTALRARIERANSELDGDVYSASGRPYSLALDIFAACVTAGVVSTPEIIDEVSASILFEKSAESLFTLEWSEFVRDEIDPEVPGLRAPQRFADCAFRLIRKLRDANISPSDFLESALRGATQFYAKPPNFANPDLLYYTSDRYRDSLNVTPADLEQQYRREVDLAKILERLYRLYLESQVRHGCLTGGDAITQAAHLLRKHPSIAEDLRRTVRAVCIDDAQQLTITDLQMLQALFGESLERVTLCGDSRSAITTFTGARPDRVFSLPATTVALNANYRTPASIEMLRNHLLGSPSINSSKPNPECAVKLFRAATVATEVAFIAEHIAALLDAGVARDQIVVLFRSVRNVEVYASALLDRNVPVQVCGDVNIFEQRVILDAIALLWNAYDPYRHDHLLRTLSGAAMRLSDASLYTLCSEPPNGQALLFEAESDAPSERSSRWDTKRDLRLGWNVTRGEQDSQLSQIARERLKRFRELRAGWVRDSLTLPLPQLAVQIFSQGLALEARSQARVLHQQDSLERLLARIAAFSSHRPSSTLGDFLQYAEQRASSEFESWEMASQSGFVRLMSLDAAQGREFDHVVIPNTRAGAF